MNRLAVRTLSGIVGLVVAVVTLGVSPARAALLSVDFNNASPTEDGFSAQGDTSEAHGAYTVDLSGNTQFFSRDSNNYIANQGAFTYRELYDDFAYTNDGSSITLTISGVAPDTAYSLQLWAFDAEPAVGVNTVTFTPTSGTLGAPGAVVYDGGTQPVTNNDFSTTLAVTSNNLGQIVVLASVSGNMENRINGFVLDNAAIPEPASMGLISLGSLLVLARRRHA
jgi:hypothetical protein